MSDASSKFLGFPAMRGIVLGVKKYKRVTKAISIYFVILKFKSDEISLAFVICSTEKSLVRIRLL